MNLENIDDFIEKFSGLTEEYKFYDGTVTLRYDPKEHVYLLVTPEGLVKQDGVTTICHIIDKSNVLLPWACKMMAQKLTYLSHPYYGTDGQPNYIIPANEYMDIIKEAKSAHKDKLEDAGEVGHIAHGWIEKWIKNDLSGEDFSMTILEKDNLESRALSCCDAALKWMQNHNVRWIGTERKIYSREYQYAGTMDGLCKADSCNDPKCCPVAFKDRLTLVDWKTSNYLYIEYIFQTGAYKAAYEEETNEFIEDVWIIRLGKTDAEFEAWHVQEELATLGFDVFLRCLYLSRGVRKIEELVQEIKDERKALERQEKQAAKEAALKVKCKNADRYKGVRKPTCNGGNPCETCLKKYNDRLQELESVGISKDVYEIGFELTDNLVAGLQKLLDKPE